MTKVVFPRLESKYIPIYITWGVLLGLSITILGALYVNIALLVGERLYSSIQDEFTRMAILVILIFFFFPVYNFISKKLDFRFMLVSDGNVLQLVQKNRVVFEEKAGNIKSIVYNKKMNVMTFTIEEMTISFELHPLLKSNNYYRQDIENNVKSFAKRTKLN